MKPKILKSSRDTKAGPSRVSASPRRNGASRTRNLPARNGVKRPQATPEEPEPAPEPLTPEQKQLVEGQVDWAKEQARWLCKWCRTYFSDNPFTDFDLCESEVYEELIEVARKFKEDNQWGAKFMTFAWRRCRGAGMKAVIKVVKERRAAAEALAENSRLFPATNTLEAKLLIQDVCVLGQALNEQEREVINGMYFQQKDSLDIALRLGVSRGRVNQIERTALAKMFAFAEELKAGSIEDWLPVDEVNPVRSKRRAGADEQSEQDFGGELASGGH